MANINLPNRFKEKLDEDQGLDGIVKQALSTFGEILQDNKLYFFPEYTDHGIKHIEKVIASTNNLITDKTFNEIVSTNDIGYYILTVILHDLGMHLSFDGFVSIINGYFDDVQIQELDKSKWSTLWEEYLDEAKKFSGKQLKNIFGDQNTVIRTPPLHHRSKIDEDDKRLIGEFIRRNHPRIAHEIALKGFPGVDAIRFGDSISHDIKNLIGLIARSHGKDLRSCVDFLEKLYGKNGRRYPFNVHAGYLMVLLRLSDYIQIDKTRASETVLKTKFLASPISVIEHNAHLAIDYIDSKYQDDPERIFVSASPKDSLMFLKLKKLIKDIQYEFDISWAVLGELYGTLDGKPEIRFRRITSNLEEQSFLSRQEYVADTFSFKSNDEILKLLIAPLYGDDPKYGIRELLQNSVDACKEREIIERKQGNFDYLPNIEVSINDDKKPYLLLADNGIGMDADVIKNYFLSAGASYRKNSDWQREFIDDKGETIVRRSGRFGVGILAAFLIGSEITVQTKKLGDDVGYKFTASLDEDQINIIKDKDVLIGTSICIELSADILNILNKPIKDDEEGSWYKWYTLTNPTINYFMFGKKINSFKTLNPDLNEDLPIQWNAFDATGFNRILYTYSKDYPEVPFSCNGIVVPHDSYEHSRVLDTGLIHKAPKISIFDNNGFTPISLDRNSFTRKLSFSKDFLNDLYKDFIAKLLTFRNPSVVSTSSVKISGNRLNYPGNSTYNFGIFYYGINIYETSQNNSSIRTFFDTILISKKGYILNYNYFINTLKSVKTILIQGEDLMLGSTIDLDLKDYFFLYTSEKINSIPDYVSAIESKNWDQGVFLKINSRIFLKESKYNFLFSKTTKRVSYWLSERCKIQYNRNGWTCLHLDEPSPTIINDHFLNLYFDKINFMREWSIECKTEGDKLLNSLLMRYLGTDVIIPFSMEERRKKYPLAFQELERYMKKYLTD